MDPRYRSWVKVIGSDVPELLLYCTLSKVTPTNACFQSSTSSSGSSSEERDRKRALSNLVSEDVDAICVQQTESMAEDVTAQLKPTDKSEPDGFFIPEKPETSCGLDCLYVTMKCCECTILQTISSSCTVFYVTTQHKTNKCSFRS